MCRLLKKGTITLFDLSTSVSFAIVQGTDILTLSLRFPLWLQPLLWTLLIWNFLLWTFDLINLCYLNFLIWQLCLSLCLWTLCYMSFTRHWGSMSVSEMHLWHDSRAVEWCSATSLFGWNKVCFGRGVWMHPRSVSVSDMIWFVWWLMLCAIHVLHISGS